MTEKKHVGAAASIDERSTTSPSLPQSRHDVVWTEEKIKLFWDICSQELSHLFFSHAAGETILRIVRKDLGSDVLEVGCGSGFLVRKLKAMGYRVIGVDISPPPGPEFVTARSAGLDRFPSASFDTVLAIEMFEHLLPEDLAPTLRAIRHVLRPHGKLIFTTPLAENLRDSHCICPDCHAVFHRFQHQQSFDPDKVRQYLRENGYRGTRFIHFDNPPDFVPRFLRPWAAFAKSLLKRKLGKLTTLITIAQPA